MLTYALERDEGDGIERIDQAHVPSGDGRRDRMMRLGLKQLTMFASFWVRMKRIGWEDQLRGILRWLLVA